MYGYKPARCDMSHIHTFMQMYDGFYTKLRNNGQKLGKSLCKWMKNKFEKQKKLRKKKSKENINPSQQNKINLVN